jgi:hypothetical protein
MRVTETCKWMIVNHRFALVQKSPKDKNVGYSSILIRYSSALEAIKVYVLCSGADFLKAEQAESHTHKIITSRVYRTHC